MDYKIWDSIEFNCSFQLIELFLICILGEFLNEIILKRRVYNLLRNVPQGFNDERDWCIGATRLESFEKMSHDGAL